MCRNLSSLHSKIQTDNCVCVEIINNISFKIRFFFQQPNRDSGGAQYDDALNPFADEDDAVRKIIGRV